MSAQRTDPKRDPYLDLLAKYETLLPSEVIEVPYLSALASGMYASVYTRGDVAYHFAFLSRFSARPFQEAWDALLNLLSYLYRTRKRCVLKYTDGPVRLPYVPSARPPLNPSVIQKLGGLIIFSDSSWKTGATYAGAVVLYAGAAVDWLSSLMKVMCSSAEAEIGAGSLAARRSIYVRSVLGFIMGELPQLPITHIVDNSATPPLTENLGVAKKTEHYRRWLHFMRYAVLHGHIYVHLCKTDEQLADSLTKVMNKSAYLAFLKVFFNISL